MVGEGGGDGSGGGGDVFVDGSVAGLKRSRAHYKVPCSDYYHTITLQ